MWGPTTETKAPPPFPFPEEVLRCLVEEGGVRCLTGMGAGYDGVNVGLLQELGCYWANNPSTVGIRTASVLISATSRVVPE
jgi:lactate dehydrogenase-like 2-hydroxyacid dehydrogenase